LDFDFRRKLIVREVMSSPVVTVREGQSVVEAAEVMSDNKIGAIIVESEDGQPIGIVTERDLVYRVLAKDTVPREIPVKEVMSSPLRTVDPDATLEDAMAVMNKANIRRLGVIYKGNLEGMISYKDIIRIMPTIIEIVRERSKIQSSDRASGLSTVGYCDRCEMYSTNLRSVDGEFLCEDCRVEGEQV